MKKMLLFFLALLVVRSSAFSIDISRIWEAHTKLYDKTYDESEVPTRFKYFQETTAFIAKHNVEADLKKLSFWTGLNERSDLSQEERQRLNGCIIPESPPDFEKSGILVFNRTSLSGYPENFDNRKLGLVTRVVNQGQCGCCWIFSAIVALEGQWAKYECELIKLSEQNIMDCTKDGPCSGGNPFSAYEYFIKHGINADKDYPYVAKQQKSCLYNSNKVVAVSRALFHVQYNDETVLRNAVYEVGPISIVMFSENKDFTSYKSGVFDMSGKCGDAPDHAMAVVGYGVDKPSGKPYWIVKNSWGPGFGEKGYIRVRRGKNLCFIAYKPSFAVV